MKFKTYSDYLDDLEANKMRFKCKECDEIYDEEYWHCPKCEGRMKQVPAIPEREYDKEMDLDV